MFVTYVSVTCPRLETLLPGRLETSGPKVYHLYWVFAVFMVFAVNFFLVFRGVFANQTSVHSGRVSGGRPLVTGDRWHMISDTWRLKLQNLLFRQFWYKCFYPHTLTYSVSSVCRIFKASALLAAAFYKSKCPSVCRPVCLSFCLFTFEVPFKRLFAPTSWSRMSQDFRDSESLGKSNGNKWSQIWKLLLIKSVKLPR